MALDGIVQPEVLAIHTGLRLRKWRDDYPPALAWYQDEETVWLVDGDGELYTPDLLGRMYDYLATEGECYWIEVLGNSFG